MADEPTVVVNESDSMFQMYVDFAEAGAEVPIVLSANGLLVSGRLISRESYLDKLEEEFRQGGGMAPQIAQFMRDARERAAEEKDEENDEGEESEAEYFYLADTYILQGGNLHGMGIWRGKVASVDGFALGELSRS